MGSPTGSDNVTDADGRIRDAIADATRHPVCDGVVTVGPREGQAQGVPYVFNVDRDGAGYTQVNVYVDANNNGLADAEEVRNLAFSFRYTDANQIEAQAAAGWAANQSTRVAAK